MGSLWYFASNITTEDIQTMKFQYEIHFFEPRIETNFLFITLEVINTF